MKKLFRHLLYWYLALIARLLLLRYRPTVIAVAGTVNKAFAKEAIGRILAEKGLRADMAYNGFNTEIGLPLAILGLPSGYESYVRWLAILPRSLKALFARRLAPVLLLELGVSRPGDLQKLLRIIHPQVAVITDLTQRYRENFSDLAALSREYELLIKHLPLQGLAVLNYDTISVRSLAASSAAPVFFFSLEAQPVSRQMYALQDLKKTTAGQSAEAITPAGPAMLEIPRFGRHHAAAALCALIIDRHFIP